MKFLKHLFQNEVENEPNSAFKWVELHRVDQLNILDDTSYHHPQLIFKHSTRCGISSMVKRSFERQIPQPPEGLTYYFLDLIRYRELSNAIAEKYGIRHESPQILLIRDGAVVAHASHHSINAIDLREWI